MKHIALSVLGILALSTALSTSAFAQAPADATTATAVLALPANHARRRDGHQVETRLHL